MLRRDLLRSVPGLAMFGAVPVAAAAPLSQTPQEVVQDCLATIYRVLKETAPEGFEVGEQIFGFADGGLVSLATRPGYKFGGEKFSWDKTHGWVRS